MSANDTKGAVIIGGTSVSFVKKVLQDMEKSFKLTPLNAKIH